MPDRFSSVTKPARVFWMFLLLVILGGMVLPQSTVTASPMVAFIGNSENTGSSYSIFERDYKKLSQMYARNKSDVKPLSKGLDRLLNNYKTLQNRGNKNWVEMRVLFYDYNSYYQAAISHKYEVELLLENHNGFNSKGKVINAPMAKYTVGKLRGAVVQMISSIDKANATLKEGNKLMKNSAPTDKKKK